MDVSRKRSRTENKGLDYNPAVPLVRELMREYSAQLGIDLCFQNFEEELAQLPGRYAAPQGCLIVAYSGDQPAGCGAFRPLNQSTCEMKRLYVRPRFRGLELGRFIAEALIAAAQRAGYLAMRLDTLSSMHAAIALYRSLGFQEIAPYYRNPVPNSLFFEAILTRVNQ